MSFRVGFLTKASFLGLFIPALGFSAAFEVNGVCQTGFNCSPSSLSASALTVGTSTTGNYSFAVTLGDGDMYNVTGSYFNNFPGTTFLGFYPTVTYAGPNPSVAADTITLDMLQDFSSPGAASWDGTYNEKIPLVLPVAGSSATGQVLYDGKTVGLLGPVFGTGNYYLTQTTPLTGLTGSTLMSDYMLSFTFPAGTQPGGSAGSPVPEPAQTIPAAIGLIGLFCFTRRRSLFGKFNQ